MMDMIAKLLGRPAVADWLIRRAQRTPFDHILDADGSYLEKRYWLFNPRPATGWRSMLPSIRIHNRISQDRDQRLYCFPWDTRTFVLRGSYQEERRHARGGPLWWGLPCGTTERLPFGQYHRISEVSEGGVWTMIVMGKWRGLPGFQGTVFRGERLYEAAASRQMPTTRKDERNGHN